MHCLWRIPSRLKWVPEHKWFRNQCYFLRLSYVWWQSAGPCQMNDIFINGHGSNGASGEKGGNLFIKSAGVLCKPEYLLEKSSWLFDTIQIWKCTIHSVAALNWRLSVQNWTTRWLTETFCHTPWEKTRKRFLLDFSCTRLVTFQTKTSEDL